MLFKNLILLILLICLFPPSEAMTLDELKKSADNGNLLSQYELSQKYLTDGYNPQKDYEKGIELLLKVAEQGVPDAEYALGLKYYSGKGITKDHAKALEWKTKAADKGHMLAQLNVGKAYLYGKGVSQNFQKGVDYLKNAATSVDAKKQLDIEMMHLLKDSDFQKILKRNTPRYYSINTDARLVLADVYMHDYFDHPHDYTLAYYWLNLAAESNTKSTSPASKTKQIDQDINQVQKVMTLTQILKAKSFLILYKLKRMLQT